MLQQLRGKARARLLVGAQGSSTCGAAQGPSLRTSGSDRPSEAALLKPGWLLRSREAPAPRAPCPKHRPGALPALPAQPLLAALLSSPAALPARLPAAGAPAAASSRTCPFLGSDRVFSVKATSLPVQPEVGAGRAAPPRRVPAPPRPPGRAERGPRAAPRGARRHRPRWLFSPPLLTSRKDLAPFSKNS